MDRIKPCIAMAITDSHQFGKDSSAEGDFLDKTLHCGHHRQAAEDHITNSWFLPGTDFTCTFGLEGGIVVGRSIAFTSRSSRSLESPRLTRLLRNLMFAAPSVVNRAANDTASTEHSVSTSITFIFGLPPRAGRCTTRARLSAPTR